MTRSRVYRDGKLAAEDIAPDELVKHLDDKNTFAWLDLAEPAEEHLTELANKLGMRQRTVQDAVRPHQRPRLNHYQDHALVIAYAVSVTEKTGVLHAHELAIFVTPHALVTVRRDDGIDPGEFVERWDAEPELAECGVSYLLYGILDYLANSQLDALQVLDERVDALEESVFTESPTSTGMQRRLMRMHRSLALMRRKVIPMEPVLNSVMRRDTAIYEPRMTPYYQDALDHVLYAADQIESLRDLIATIRDTQLNLQGNRMNMIMKKVTSWAGIIAVPTLITGIYGQNVPFPGVDQPLGAWLSTVAIVLASVGLYVVFKKKDWL
jgi:magnesium transporter